VRSKFRVWLVALAVSALSLAAVSATAAQAQSLEVERFVATNCKSEAEYTGAKKCGSEEFTLVPFGPYSRPKEEVTVPEAEKEGYTQAGGRVPYGVTDFEVKTEGTYPNAKPVNGVAVDHVRVDVATGLATAPDAVPTCSSKEFGETEAIPTTGLYTESKCESDTEIGEEKVTLYVAALKELGFTDLPLRGTVYNLEQPEGLASYYGVALKFPKEISEVQLGEVFKGSNPTAEKEQYYVHSFVKGSVEWGQETKGTDAGDYHDYFEVEASPADPLISSRQVLYGTSGNGAFITNATSCPGDNTTYVTLEDTAKETTREFFKTPIGLKGCEGLEFEPTFGLTGATSISDEPDELTTEVKETNEPTKNSPAQVKTASITLPEGMTLNPSAANKLEACTESQARIHSATFGVECPEGSEIGTVSLEVPTLPAKSFTGNVYLGSSASAKPTEPAVPSESNKVTGGPPYIIYVVANSKRYGISVRIKGEVIPNEVTGQVTTVFNENPEQPFTNLAIKFDREALTPLANPLVCGNASGSATFTPVSAKTASAGNPFSFATTGCASSIPFALSQSTGSGTSNAGAHSSFTFSLGRQNGQQYLSKVSTTLPEGLVGEIPAVKQCSEAEVAAAEANTGGCSTETQIGTATVLAGSGSTPYTFTGNVYLTGPYDGAPYGLAVVVPATALPAFELGNVVTRATININPETTRVTIASTLPTIHKGIPLRVRNITIAVTKQGFMLNPTNCTTPLATESTLTSTMGATQSGLSTAFPVTNCSALAFKPTFAAKTSAKTSKANGASLETTLNLPLGDGNVKSALVQLPLELPSRLTTLQKACTEAVFAANPYSCPAGSFVGGARANTPVLPDKLSGPAILVSHGGEAFPDLDLVLEADNVRVILVGHTKITKGITTTDFSTTPDAPVTSITVSLPVGSHSALTNYGQLCPKPLVMPTTITGQNGVVFKQNTIIKVAGCSVRIVGHKVVGNTAYITVQTFAAGRVSGSGKSLSTAYARFNRARKTATLKVSLSGKGRHRGRPFKVKLRVGFLPKQKGLSASASFATLSFR
jgi:hypothetical protein